MSVRRLLMRLGLGWLGLIGWVFLGCRSLPCAEPSSASIQQPTGEPPEATLTVESLAELPAAISTLTSD
jgi:hypothetical protein